METKISTGSHTPVWFERQKPITFETLLRDVTADVCVVGAGIAGLSTAYAFLERGKSVVVIDRGAVASGDSGRTSAHLSNALDDRYTALEKLHGLDGARAAAQSHAAAIDWIESVAARENISCDFERVNGYLFPHTQSAQRSIDEEYDACRRIGLPVVRELDIPWNFYESRTCLRFPNQAVFHPTQFCAGLVEAILRKGGKIYTETTAENIEDSVVYVGKHRITASTIVVATNVPFNERLGVHTKQAAYRTFLLTFRIPKDSLPYALYWDTSEPYHYVRILHQDDEHDLLLVGGEDHKVGQDDDAEDQYKNLETWARAHFPLIESLEGRWSGQIVEPSDGLAFIGRHGSEKNVYLCTGDSGNGLTHGVIAALMLPDLAEDKTHPWEKLYSPERLPLKPNAAKEFLRENLNVIPQYADWVTPGEVAPLPPDCGLVARDGMTKRAIYRDPQGEMHVMSAVCPHLGCIVRWNSEEKTFDCPCHGSRFNGYGDVLNGPANSGLTPLSRNSTSLAQKDYAPRRNFNEPKQ
jgi:glycine/D-amino acid oxidase-like deaminating enzyme/nitrite reductase/ring-hydroxylating ferredoxin subunit